MPWARDANMAGFTSAPDAWLPLDPRHRALAVDAQEADPNSVLAFARKMIALRKSSAALREGDFVACDAPDPVLAFERVAGSERVLCVFNLGDQPTAYAGLDASAQTKLVVAGASVANGTAALPPYSALFASFL
jgi:alpha-glucosidase